MKSVMKTILVISREGEDPDKIAEMYAAEREVEPHIFMLKNKARENVSIEADNIRTALLSRTVSEILSDAQKEYLYDRVRELFDMTADEYFKQVTRENDCTYDDEGNAYTTKNPLASYQYPKCYQQRLEITGEEAQFSNPFKLKDGGIAYRAHFNDIDWSEMHNYNREIYEAAWELCVEGREPEDEQEKMIKEQMKNRTDYFFNFKNKEEYVDYSTMFFTFGIATKHAFISRNEMVESEIDYVRGFYDKYISKITDNPLLSIYEVRSL